jgi:capsular exopolysaccharide synthesis family protein
VNGTLLDLGETLHVRFPEEEPPLPASAAASGRGAQPSPADWSTVPVSPAAQDDTDLAGRINPDVLEKTVAGALRTDSIEQYRRISGLLHHAQESRGVKVIMVASAVPGEGKTLTAANLAMTLAESFQRSVLLIDADLRRPSVHQVFRLPNKTGLSDSLHPGSPGKVMSLRVSPQLTVLPSGPPTADPMSGLTSERMRQLISEGASRYDWVVIDTPPVALLPDANLLASMVDGAVLVIGAGSTHYALVQKAVNAIGRDRVLGVVLNRYEHDRLPGSGHYYDYYYYRTYGYGAVGHRRPSLVKRLWPFGRSPKASS